MLEDMIAKPGGLGPAYRAQFGDESVAAAYGLRPPYPDEPFDVLVGLLAPGSYAILDAGCGRGEMARPLAARADRVERVDAVDPSRAMLDAGRRLPGGDSPRIRWIHGYAEDAPLASRYGLVVTATSLHWMDWDVVLPRFRDVLAPGGVLAIVNDGALPTPWDDALARIIPRYSTNQEFEPYDLIAELERRHLLQVQGRHTTRSVPFAQSTEDYVESFHARNGFSRDRMPPGSADAFDAEVRRAVAPHCPDGLVRLQVVATITWGRPALATTERES